MKQFSIYYLTPKVFKHGGWYIKLWGKRYRIIKIGEN